MFLFIPSEFRGLNGIFHADDSVTNACLMLGYNLQLCVDRLLMVVSLRALKKAKKRALQRKARGKSDNHRSIPDRDYRGFLAGCLVHCTRRYVFKRFNVSAEHVLHNAFHVSPVSKFVEEIREKYNFRAFYRQ